MKQTLSLLVQASVLMSVGCQISTENDTRLDDTQLHLNANNAETGDNAELTTDWAEISPGVWERSRSDGGFDRMGFGIEGFQFALEQARQERVGLLEGTHESSVSDLNDRLRSNQDLIEYLQSSLDEAKESGLREELPIDPPTINEVTNSSYSPSSSVSDSVCAGSYTFDINFGYSMVDGWVDTAATWSEFGPFAPYKKTLYTYSYAWSESYGQIDYKEDEDSFGPFSGHCCVKIQSSATAELTWSPMLYGRAYVSVTNGCSAFRFYESSNY